ncbi:MAG: S8 family serine peptidase, partial [Candidatus Heimdallarchaeota archaeon]|nr:S8 family serine peptidase [Candidatus Heimdallarchaeota archaeon]
MLKNQTLRVFIIVLITFYLVLTSITITPTLQSFASSTEGSRILTSSNLGYTDKSRIVNGGVMIWSETDLKVSSELSKIMDFSRLSGGLYKTNGNYAIPENAKIKALFNNNKIQLSQLKSNNIGFLENSDNSFQLSNFRSLMNLDPLYDQNDFGDDVIVAVVDTGVDPDHPAMTGKVFAAESFVTTQLEYPANENSIDSFGHGTAVSSIIAGSHLNYRGIAPETKIVSAKVGDKDGIITSSGLLAAIDWILTIDEVDIINFSLGEPEEGPELDVLEIAINEAVKMGKIVISSAGNAAVSGLSSYEPFSLSSPGSAPEAISIGSISFGGTISSFSSEGPSMNWEAKPDFVAPGQSIRIAKLMTNYNCGVESSESCFSSLSGTSFSTPVVAGAVSLLVSSLKRQNITYTPGTVKAAMHITADSLGIYWSEQGSGLPNIGNATA